MDKFARNAILICRGNRQQAVRTWNQATGRRPRFPSIWKKIRPVNAITDLINQASSRFNWYILFIYFKYCILLWYDAIDSRYISFNLHLQLFTSWVTVWEIKRFFWVNFNFFSLVFHQPHDIIIVILLFE